jgi:type IV pilus assembly protein PilM
LSSTLVESVKKIFQPQLPFWACEFTERRLIVAGVSGSRKRVSGKVAADIPPGLVNGSLTEKNFADPIAAREAVQSALKEARFRGSEIAAVIPDSSARIAFITAENLPKGQTERDAFIRWKLKKTMPFDVEKAQIAIKPMGPHVGDDAQGIDIMVALSPREIVEEYVELMRQLDIHAGLVIPSTIAALNLLGNAQGDVLFVKVAPGGITTTIVQDDRIQFSRRVAAEMPLYDAVHPTFQYYQDKLNGRGFARVLVCSDRSESGEMADLERKLGVQAHSVEPKSIEDIYKPALGAVGLVWANII